MLQAFLVYIAVFGCFFFHYFFGNCLTDRPIIVGTVVGAILGDLKTGILLGAEFELIFLGITNAGGVVPANTALGTSCAVALAIISGLNSSEALAIAVPVALLGSQLITLMYTLRAAMNPYIDKLIEKNDQRSISTFVFVQAIVCYLIIFLPVFIVVAFGQGPVNAIIAAIPPFVTKGLSAASGMLSAVGFGMLLNLVWRNDLAIYFFVGYLLSAYFGLPVLGVALCGLVYSVIVFMNRKNKPKTATVANEEGELFND